MDFRIRSGPMIGPFNIRGRTDVKTFLSLFGSRPMRAVKMARRLAEELIWAKEKKIVVGQYQRKS
jgi:hypothetical protein